MHEVRAQIHSIDAVKKLLISMQAQFKGEYAFEDQIYHPTDKPYNLNQEFVRLRIYQKTNWNQKRIEFCHKIRQSKEKGEKQQFDTANEALPLLKNHRLAFSYKRHGFEYTLGTMRLFVEDIEGLPNSIEIIATADSQITAFFAHIQPIQIFKDSVPKLLENSHKIHALFCHTPLAVMSTIGIDQKHAESALVAFTQNRALNLYFMTFVDSRKYANLQQNPSVSFVIGFGYTTIQYEGIVSQLAIHSIDEALKAFKEKETPCTPDFLSNPRARFFKVTPSWIRYSDYTCCPADIWENFYPNN